MLPWQIDKASQLLLFSMNFKITKQPFGLLRKGWGERFILRDQLTGLWRNTCRIYMVYWQARDPGENCTYGHF